ncbi:MAG: hypothetical protein Q7J29_11530 [Stagnimonas sp.]|nr:hypothetical protein [Stagnimonas sp.]
MKLLLKAPLSAALLLLAATAAAQSEPAAAPPPAVDATVPPVTAPEAGAVNTGTVTAADPATEAATLAEQQAREQEESFRDAREDAARDARKGFAIAARVSTLGLGIEAVTSIHKRVNLRVQGNLFNYDRSIKEDDVDYDGKLKLQTFGALVDFHPFAGGTRLSAGLYSNGNKVDLKASCKTECDVGDFTVSSNPGDNPQLFGGIDFKSVAPYVGFGYGNAMTGFPLHFAFDIGVLLQGSPKVNLNATGTATVTDNDTGTTTRRNLATDPEFQSALADEERNAEDSSKEFKYYPVISFTLGYRFRLL